MRPLGFSCLTALPPAVLGLSYLLSTSFYVYQVFAADEDSIIHEDHNHPRLLGLTGEVVGYESEFLGIDRSIIGRADNSDQTLGNSAPGILNIEQGKSQFWTFPKETLFGSKAPQTPGLPSPLVGQYVGKAPDSPDERALYISLTVCDQPTPKVANPNGAPDQLKLYISTSSSNREPSASKNDFAVPVDGGFGSLNISAKGDVFFGVSAPINVQYTGVYNYHLTASIDGFYAQLINEHNLDFIDSDTTTALLYTSNLTDRAPDDQAFKEWMESDPPPFSIYVHNQDNSAILGLQNSVCGLKNNAQLQGDNDVDSSMTRAGANPIEPKQQFYVKNLNGSSSYYAIVTIDGNSTVSKNGAVGGGGIVWNFPVNFTTKSGTLPSSLVPLPLSFPPTYKPTTTDNNCALIHSLPFCSQVAYAVPSNPKNKAWANTTALGLHYDTYASSYYQNFSYSLQQIACATTDTAQYSLAKTCDDCDAAYREWLCAVSIPRCEDFSNPAPYLQPRAINTSFINATYGNAVVEQNPDTFSTFNKSRNYYNSSRNTMIDNDIRPGPYKEVLPCKDLCYELVRSCPAALGFACPVEGHGMNYTYGSTEGSGPGITTCNAPGVGLNAGSSLRLLGWVHGYVVLTIAVVIMFV
ncbi:stretch-activated cation channel mid1 [Puttea exsequens]|nr:stretch-activated cation channel mid1 [Puttea exsequens]